MKKLLLVFVLVGFPFLLHAEKQVWIPGHYVEVGGDEYNLVEGAIGSDESYYYDESDPLVSAHEDRECESISDDYEEELLENGNIRRTRLLNDNNDYDNYLAVRESYTELAVNCLAEDENTVEPPVEEEEPVVTQPDVPEEEKVVIKEVIKEVVREVPVYVEREAEPTEDVQPAEEEEDSSTTTEELAEERPENVEKPSIFKRIVNWFKRLF